MSWFSLSQIRRVWAGQRLPKRTPISRPSTPIREHKTSLDYENSTVVLTLSPGSHHLIRLHSPPFADLGDVRAGCPPSPSRFCPATVIRYDTPEILNVKVQKFRADNEFDQNFLSTIVLVASHKDTTADDTLNVILGQTELRNAKSVFLIQDTIPEGPYFVRDRKLYQTWRLYPDTYEAFHLPTIHDRDSDKLSPLLSLHHPWLGKLGADKS